MNGRIWADTNTVRGKVEQTIATIVSGGATMDVINAAVDKIMEAFPPVPKPTESIQALKRALLNELPKKGEDLPPESIECRLHNMRLILSCTSWSN